MRRIVYLILTIGWLCVSMGAGAHAATISSPATWLGNFKETLANGQRVDIESALSAAPFNHSNAESLSKVFDFLYSFMKDRPPSYSDVIQTTTLGTSVFRGIIMVNYDDNTPIFVLVDFLRSKDGWVIDGLDFNTNLTALMTWPWPYH